MTEDTQGNAPLGGSFRLTFRGATTTDIGAADGVSVVEAALEALDTIEDGGVTVSDVTSEMSTSATERLLAVTFTGTGVGGNVEAMSVGALDNELTGNSPSIEIYTDGTETATERRAATTTSVTGNELGETFTLTLRGHTTDPIEFNAADTTMKSRLEGLPNIGTVDVKRSAPDPELGYTWTVTFLSNPGYFPVESRNVDPLSPDTTYLTGDNAGVSVVSTDGTDPLDGYFQLLFTDGTYTNSTDELDKDISAADLKAELEELDIVGAVDVHRTTNVDGYTWLVTFNGCRTVGVTDVCNIGDLASMTTFNALTGGAGPEIEVTEVVAGSGPGACDGDDGLCWDTVTDLSGGAPYTYDVTELTTGTPYYVRVSAHTAMSYGRRALSTPEYEMPANTQPGKVTPVRMVASTRTSISLEWDYPTQNGGTPVIGFELWMDDWAGGNSRIVLDGTDQVGGLCVRPKINIPNEGDSRPRRDDLSCFASSHGASTHAAARRLPEFRADLTPGDPDLTPDLTCHTSPPSPT